MNQDFAIIYDMDGVLVDSNPAHKIALKRFCHQHGFDLTEDDLRNKIYGRTNKGWITNLFGELPPEQLAQYGTEKEAIFRDIYAPDIVAVKGLIEFLEQMAKAGIPQAVGTSAPRANVDFVFEKTGIGHFFPVVLDESAVTVGKPHPEIYLKVAAALNYPPERCVVIEDSLSGVEAGKAAGCKVMGITTTHTPEEFAHCDDVFDDFTQLHAERLAALFA
jgi:HAD superfamily hydrolase (TIGR01509 family)